LPEPEEELEDSPSARPFWSGTITFGLVSIPVALYAATRTSRVSLRMLSPDGTPLKRRYYSAATGKDLDADDIVRGYEVEKNRWVTVTDDELERLAPEKSRDIDLRRFVKDSQIPRLYFERGYFLAPSGGSVKAYRLLAETMQQTGRAGIATFVMRGKEYLIAILAENGYLRAETLRFAEEVRSPEDIGLPAKPKITKRSVQQFEKLIGAKEADELPREELKNKRNEKLLALVEKKQAKKEDVIGHARAAEEEPDVVDILSLLQQRLSEVKAGRKMAARSSSGRSAKKSDKPAARKHSRRRS
jgi:DNA end-binding protein Ku